MLIGVNDGGGLESPGPPTLVVWGSWKRERGTPYDMTFLLQKSNVNVTQNQDFESHSRLPKPANQIGQIGWCSASLSGAVSADRRRDSLGRSPRCRVTASIRRSWLLPALGIGYLALSSRRGCGWLSRDDARLGSTFGFRRARWKILRSTRSRLHSTVNPPPSKSIRRSVRL